MLPDPPHPPDPSDRPEHRPEDRPEHRPKDRPKDPPEDRPKDRPVRSDPPPPDEGTSKETSGEPEGADPSQGNRLRFETSPYLLQHRDNPVHWKPWGPAAFEEAERRDAPVLLSIGYSTCHWCHVMARESFENEEIARYLNDRFVPVKVDREERADVDDIYMSFVQMTTGHGGWPLTVFLAPDRTPFFGGTYFPPVTRGGHIGFAELLGRISAAWSDRGRRANLLSGGGAALDRLRRVAALPSRAVDPSALIDDGPISAGARHLLRAFDPEHGGFGAAPKFPPSRQTLLLMGRHLRSGDPEALAAAVRTLEKMADGGIHDQLGGGFHRYSTDAAWRTPHFEKMLYDNALLAPAYSLAWRITGNPRLAETLRGVLGWIVRELRGPGGQFWSALDADSEGKEGRFYLWDAGQIESVLGDGAALFASAYDLSPSPGAEGRIALRRIEEDDVVGARFGLRPEDVRRRLAAARERLFLTRSHRPRPGLDHKVLLGWNALAISAFADAHRALGDNGYRAVAEAAGGFVLENMRRDGRLLAVWNRGGAKIPARLDDHAFWLAAALDLYESTFDERWLDSAAETAATLERRFPAPGGGFHSTADDQEALPVRTLSAYDGALPAGNAVAADALLRLAALTGDRGHREAARRTILPFLSQVGESPAGFASLLLAIRRYVDEPRQLVVIGDHANPRTGEALRRLWRAPAPGAVVLWRAPAAPGRESRIAAVRAASEAAGRRGADGSGPEASDGSVGSGASEASEASGSKVVFVPCRGRSCQLPLDDLDAAEAFLRTP